MGSDISQNEYDVAFDLEYNTGSSNTYLKKLNKVKELEASGNFAKADKKMGKLTNWLSQQYPGRDKKRGTARAFLNEGTYSTKTEVLEEVEIKPNKK
jgi:hypothetical protein